MKESSFALAAAHAQGMNEREKIKGMNLENPRKVFKSVPEREDELIQNVDPSYRLQL